MLYYLLKLIFLVNALIFLIKKIIKILKFQFKKIKTISSPTKTIQLKLNLINKINMKNIVFLTKGFVLNAFDFTFAEFDLTLDAHLKTDFSIFLKISNKAS